MFIFNILTQLFIFLTAFLSLQSCASWRHRLYIRNKACMLLKIENSSLVVRKVKDLFVVKQNFILMLINLFENHKFSTINSHNADVILTCIVSYYITLKQFG